MSDSSFVKRSVTLAGHRTSVSLEPPFWEEIEAAALRRAVPLARLITEIDRMRAPDQPLSSALRLFVLSELQQRVSD